METDLTPSDTGQDTGISSCRKDLTRGGNPRLAPDQPLWSPETAVRGASTLALARTDLHGVAGPTGIEPDQLRCQRSLQRSVQRTITLKDESTRYPGGSAPVD